MIQADCRPWIAIIPVSGRRFGVSMTRGSDWITFTVHTPWVTVYAGVDSYGVSR